MVKDEDEIDYYKQKITAINQNEPAVRHEVPHFASDNTDWKLVPMKEVREFCQREDT